MYFVECKGVMAHLLTFQAMGTEITEQNQRIQRLGDKSTNLDTRIFAGTQKLERIGK